MAPSPILRRDLRRLSGQLDDLAAHLDEDCQPLCQCVVLDLVHTVQALISEVDRIDSRVHENHQAILELDDR